ncbi:hypothetical protein I5375_23370 [Citrobacter freundii]|nr:hypothetical protein [Citrobacter freundii]
MTRIHQLIRKHLNIRKASVQDEITVVSLAYILKVASAKDLNAVVLRYTSQNALAYRTSLNHHYVIKNIKFWLWYCIYSGLNEEEADEASDNFDIRPKDFPLYHLLKRSQYWKAIKQLSLSQTKEGGLRYKAWSSLHRFESIIQKVLKEQETYLKKYIHKKLKFLTFSGYSDVEDIYFELQYAGVMGLYKIYPMFDSRLHLTNIYKRSIQNFGCNQIKHHTTQGRSVLDRQADGTFQSRKVSLDSLMSVDSTVEGDYSLSGEDEDTNALSYDDVNNKLAVRKALAKVTNKERRLLILLKGNYDKDFSSYLHKKGHSDSDELFDKMLKSGIHKYVNLAAKYLKMSVYDAHSCLIKLRTVVQ